jgi:hypothetical protein
MPISIPNLSVANTIAIIRGVADNPAGYIADVVNCVHEHIMNKLKIADRHDFFPLVTTVGHKLSERTFASESVIQLIYTRGTLEGHTSLEFRHYH